LMRRHSVQLVSSLFRHPPCSTLFPYTTLFRSGRGTVDMKAGVAVQLKLAAELVSPRVDITWMWYDHEEVDADLNGLTRLSRTRPDRKSTRLNSSHVKISYAVLRLKTRTEEHTT